MLADSSVCKAGLTSVRRIWLTRHGESQYNQKGLIGGNSSLSERGERYARCLPEALIARLPQDEPVSVAVWTSTLKRTIETARFLPFPKLRWKALDEINAGICDGMTYEDIAQRYPEEYAARKKDKLRYRYPAGESYMDVIQRIEPVIIELERERECVVVVAHQAVLRAVYAYFMGVPSEDIPCLDIPLHTLIELNPMPDGTMSERRFPVDIDSAPALPLLPGERAAAAATRVGIKSAMAHAGLSPQGSFNASSSQCGAAAAVGLKGEAGADGSTQPVSPASGTPETNSAEAAAGAVAGVGAAAGVEASSGALVAEAVVAGA